MPQFTSIFISGSCAKNRLQVLLLDGLDGEETHAWPAHRFTDSFGFVCVVFVTLDVIKLIYKDIDYAHGVGVRHVVVECFGKKKALSTIVTLNEPLHLTPPTIG